MKYSRKVLNSRELYDFYIKLFEGTNTTYGFISYPHTFCPISKKEIVLPLPFMKIINTLPMQMANQKIQTAHCYKEHFRMEDTRLDHMVFAQSLGVDLLSLLEKKGYEIDNQTRIAFLVFLLTHDIGHGPFSHPFEQMVNGYKGMHEDIGRRALVENEELHSILESIYPGLTERVIHFKDYDQYGLSSLLEGIFDLDRAAFLIMDTFLMEGEEHEDSFYDIVDGVYKIFDSIILKKGKVFFDYKCFREMDDFIRIRRENYEVYQSPKRVLDDLLLKRIGERAPVVIEAKEEVFHSLAPSIQTEITNFIVFIVNMKELKSDIPLDQYYSFGDYHFERIFQFLLLLGDPLLSRDCYLSLSSFSTLESYYQIGINQKQNGREDFYVDNHFTIYKSKPDENITFLKGEEEIDYKDCVGRLEKGSVFLETISYTLKSPNSLSNEQQLREVLLQEINQEFLSHKGMVEWLEPKFPSDKAVIAELKKYEKSVLSNISFEEHLKIYGMSEGQLLTYLFMFTSNATVHENARMLLASSLGYYFDEETASLRMNNKQFKKQKDVI